VDCRAKDHGGMEIHDLEVKNIALVGKCVFKLLIEDAIWQTLLKMKYIDSKNIILGILESD
jgi:hypothetical protein